MSDKPDDTDEPDEPVEAVMDGEEVSQAEFEAMDKEVSRKEMYQHTSHMQVDHAPNDNLSNAILSMSHLLITLDGLNNEDVRTVGLEAFQCFMRAVVSPAKTAIFPFVKE